jgi:ferric-dicitrate binding protein FerR (iron transport regulator)
VNDSDLPLDIYAEGYGGPDLETTARARQRVQAYARERASRRTRWLYRVQGLVAAALVGGAALGIWAAVSEGEHAGAPKEHASGPVVVTEKDPQEVSLAGGGTMRVAPHSRVRLGEPEGGSAIDLLAGTVEVTLPEREEPWRFRSGDYALHADGAGFLVERRNGAPRVTVRAGTVTLFGPDLPDAGVEIVAPEG